MSSPKVDVVDSTNRRKVELQGARPAPLSVQSQSHMIRKSSRKPVIIYMVSPKVIHAEACEFMSLVQRLTGLSSSPDAERELSGSCRSSYSHDKKGSRKVFPMKVKARAVNRPGSEFVKSSHQPSVKSPMSPTLFLHDWSSLSHGDNQKERSTASQTWYLSGDCIHQSPKHSSGEAVGEPTYLDIFNHV